MCVDGWVASRNMYGPGVIYQQKNLMTLESSINIYYDPDSLRILLLLNLRVSSLMGWTQDEDRIGVWSDTGTSRKGADPETTRKTGKGTTCHHLLNVFDSRSF